MPISYIKSNIKTKTKKRKCFLLKMCVSEQAEEDCRKDKLPERDTEGTAVRGN